MDGVRPAKCDSACRYRGIMRPRSETKGSWVGLGVGCRGFRIGLLSWQRQLARSARDEPLRMEDPSFSGWSQATPAGGATLHPHDADS